MADLVRHPDVVDLAEYAEGVLDASRQSAVDQHVRECADCAATLADLAGLSETLAQPPVPPLPTDVADRLDRVIAAEASARASTSADKPTSTVVPMRPRRRWLAPVLAAAAVIGVIGIAVPVLNNASGDGSSDASGAGGGAESVEDGASGHAGTDRATRPRGSEALTGSGPGGAAALSSAKFGRDVANIFFPDQHELILPRNPMAIPEDGETYYAAQVRGLCPKPADADLPYGEVHQITLDGTPAHLLISQPGMATDAVAFTCQGAEARVLASASLKAR